MKKVYYVSACCISWTFEEEEDIVEYYIYKDSVFTTREEVDRMLEIALNDKKAYENYDQVDYEVMNFMVNPLSQNINPYE